MNIPKAASDAAKAKNCLKSGQSLIEVLVSLSVATLVLFAITVAVIYSLRNTQFSKNQNLASQYASQGMEIVRQIRDNKSTLSSYTDVFYCLKQDSLTLIPKNITCGQNVGPGNIGPTPGNINLYSREVIIEHPNPAPTPPAPPCEKTYKVTVKVSWWDNACGNTSTFCHKVQLASCLSDRKNNVGKP